MRSAGGSLQLAADRVLYWWKVSDKFARLLADAPLLRSFGITVDDTDLGPLGLPAEVIKEVHQEDVDLAKALLKLVIENLAQHAWTHHFYESLSPYCFGAIFSRESLEDIKSCMESAKIRSDALVRAATTDSRVVSELLEDIDLHDSQLNLEIRAACESGGWSHRNEELRSIVYPIFLHSGNTKHSLEDVFKHVRHHHEEAGGHLGRWKRFQHTIEDPLVCKHTVWMTHRAPRVCAMRKLRASIPCIVHARHVPGKHNATQHVRHDPLHNLLRAASHVYCSSEALGNMLWGASQTMRWLGAI
jgi:hypothetical protein